MKFGSCYLKKLGQKLMEVMLILTAELLVKSLKLLHMLHHSLDPLKEIHSQHKSSGET